MKETDMTAEEKIRANAQLVLDQFRSLSELGEQFGYDKESVRWVEGFIERQRSRWDMTADHKNKLIQVLGSYLGECVIHAYGGAWRQLDDRLGVYFDEQNGVSPFSKVQKQFENGVAGGDSISGFFEVIATVFKRASSSE